MYGIAIANKDFKNPLDQIKEKFESYKGTNRIQFFANISADYIVFCNAVINYDFANIRIYLRAALRLNKEFYVTVVNGGNRLYERICKLDELYEVMDEFVYTIKSIAFKIGVIEFMEYWKNLSAVDNL